MLSEHQVLLTKNAWFRQQAAEPAARRDVNIVSQGSFDGLAYGATTSGKQKPGRV
jgi:hypothetical protein